MANVDHGLGLHGGEAAGFKGDVVVAGIEVGLIEEAGGGRLERLPEPVPRFTIVTVAPGTTAPVGSVTVPVMLPPETCAANDGTGTGRDRVTARRAIQRERRQVPCGDGGRTEHWEKTGRCGVLAVCGGTSRSSPDAGVFAELQIVKFVGRRASYSSLCNCSCRSAGVSGRKSPSFITSSWPWRLRT